MVFSPKKHESWLSGGNSRAWGNDYWIRVHLFTTIYRCSHKAV